MLAATIVKLPELPAVACPCGNAKRAFAEIAELPATVHLTQITKNAIRHYHRLQTEIYVIVSCQPDAAIELDGLEVPIALLTAIHIPPGVRHRAIGEMTALIYCTPKFDPADEYFD